MAHPYFDGLDFDLVEAGEIPRECIATCPIPDILADSRHADDYQSEFDFSFRVDPAQERLESDERAGPAVNLRLVVEAQPVLVHGLAQVALQHPAGLGLLVHGGGEDADPGGAAGRSAPASAQPARPASAASVATRTTATKRRDMARTYRGSSFDPPADR